METNAQLAPLPLTWPTLTHWSDKPLLTVRAGVNRRGRMMSCFEKPKGLWVSVDGENDWRAWCESEKFNLENFVYRNVVKLARPDLLLWVNSRESMLELMGRYSFRGAIDRQSGIRWDLVASIYAGVVIAPYMWSSRMDHRTPWYYTWDCASGCIWDPGVIEDIEVLSP